MNLSSHCVHWLLPGLIIHFFLFCGSSVKHDYEGEWLGNKTRLNTCDPHAKQIVVNSANPQEVDANKDIIFTYDVEFKVR